MFFQVSKLFWFIASPLHLCPLLLGLGLFRAARGRKFGLGLAAFAAGVLALISFSPVSAVLMRPLEDRFPAQADDMPAPDGIIVLGGAVDERIAYNRKQTTLNEAAERMTAGATLARRYPQAKLVFSGGSGAMILRSVKEAEIAKNLWRELGVPDAQMIFEDQSRNTYENALFTQRLVAPQSGQRWLLVTSAYHMPRSMGIFRALGMNPIAYPVDYRTNGNL